MVIFISFCYAELEPGKLYINDVFIPSTTVDCFKDKCGDIAKIVDGEIIGIDLDNGIYGDGIVNAADLLAFSTYNGICKDDSSYYDKIDFNNDGCIRLTGEDNNCMNEWVKKGESDCSSEPELFDASISIATLKDVYNVGEKVELTDPPDESNKITGNVVDENINLKQDTIQEIDISYLTEKQIEILAELNEKKINETRKLRKIKEEYEEIKIEGWNIINPGALGKKAVARVNMEIQEGNVNKADSALKSSLENYGVPEQVQKEIDEINEKANTWTANYNPMSVLSEKEKEKHTGLMIPEEEKALEKSSQSLRKVTESDSSLPDFFDWRNQHGENYITYIKSQGSCGSCWAFATVAALEGSINAYYNNPNSNINLAEQDLVSCCNECSPEFGCDGGYLGEALDYIKDNKIATELKFPYSGTNQACNNKASDWENTAWSIVSLDYVRTDDIKRALIEKGPLTTSIDVYWDFWRYSKGIYKHVKDILDIFKNYHAVTIVGWGTYDGLTYWIAKNSWGTKWGENGYFRIFAGELSIGSRGVYAIEQPIAPYNLQKLCNDNDKDGYCNWGLGEKPNKCPICHETIKDCDDSDPSIYEGCGATTMGTLSITSTPSEADVYVKYNGEYIHRGKTPLTTNLNIGTRKIKVIKENYTDYFTTLDIEEDKTINLDIKFKLDPKLIDPLNNDVYRTGDIIEIKGFVPEGDFQNYIIEYGIGENPTKWSSDNIILVNDGKDPINGILAIWDTNSLEGFYTIKLTINFIDGSNVEKYIEDIYLDPTLKEGWPKRIEGGGRLAPIVGDLNNDGKKEIVVQASKLYVFDSNGLLLNGWPKSIEGRIGTTQPVIADINNDGIKEIIVASSEYSPKAKVKIHIYNYNGLVNVFYIDDWFLEHWVNIVIEDLNLDGNQEIIISGDKRLYVLNNKGEILNGFPKIPNVEGISIGNMKSSPAVGNLDDDPELEIFWSMHNGNLYLFNIDGSEIWSKTIKDGSMNGRIYSSPVIGDINDDGKNEIIVSARVGDYGIYVFDNQGNILWQELFNGFEASPALTDFDKDNKLEIVVVSTYLNGQVFIFNHNGEIVSRWQAPTEWGEWYGYYSPIIGDVNGDNNLDILIISGHNKVYGWNFNGMPINGFPKKTQRQTEGGIIIDDIDNDGKIELITTGRNILYVWDLDGDYDSNNMEWSMFQHDSQHTGNYHFGEDIIPPKIKPQSKIVNNEDFDLKGILEIIIQQYDEKNDRWFDMQINTWNKTVPAKQDEISGILKLDSLFNQGGFTPGWAGQFRVIVELKDENGNIIKTKDGELRAEWEFDVVEEKIIPTKNEKNMDKYSEKEVFLISDKNWKDVLSLVPVTTWTEEDGTIRKHPTLIYHHEEENINNLYIDINAYEGNHVIRIDAYFTAGGTFNENKEISKTDNLQPGEEIIYKYSVKGTSKIAKIKIGIIPDFLEFVEPVDGTFDNLNTNFPDWTTFEFVLKVKDDAIVEIYKPFDVDSIIYFMQQYNTEKVTIVGDTPQELDNLLITEPELGAGLEQNKIQRIITDNYLSYWDEYKDVVYVEDNYELALMASTYASLINVPLIIQNSNLDIDYYFNNRNIICVGNVNRNCEENYNLESLQQKYVDETNTDKIILVNPNDLNIKVEETFTPEKSNTIFELYSKTSLATPILATAKHELILSTTSTDYEGVDSFIENKINDLGIDVDYLTIMASPDGIEMSAELQTEEPAGYSPQEGIIYRTEIRETDNLIYGNLDYDRYPELKVGRIFSITLADISSYVGRILFEKEIYNFRNKAIIVKGTSINAEYHAEHASSMLGNSGYIIQMIDHSKQKETNFLNNNLFLMSGHGNFNGWDGLYGQQLKDKDFFPSIVYIMACSTCNFNRAKESRNSKNLACTNVIRKGGFGYVGFVTDGIEGELSPGILAFNTPNNDLGTMHKKTLEDFFNPRSVLIGDPTFKPELWQINDSFLENQRLEYASTVSDKGIFVDVSLSNVNFEQEGQVYEFPKTYRALMNPHYNRTTLEINNLKIPVPNDFAVESFLLKVNIFGNNFFCNWPLQSIASTWNVDYQRKQLSGYCNIPPPQIKSSCGGYWSECNTNDDCCENMECVEAWSPHKCWESTRTGLLELEWYKFSDNGQDYLLLSPYFSNKDISMYQPVTNVYVYLELRGFQE